MMMTNSSRKAKVAGSAERDVAERLARQIHEIGVARFVGRINAGMIDATVGYRAVETFSVEEQRRPLVSRLAHMLVGKRDPIACDSETGD
jgi:hypothetical protein